MVIDSPLSALISIVVTVLSYLSYLGSLSYDLKYEIRETIVNILSTVKTIDSSRNDCDVIRKLFEMQVGSNIAKIVLPNNTAFPQTIVPGGDIALIMDQKAYSKLLIELLGHSHLYSKIRWTTVIPFEDLNNLDTEEYFNYVRSWNKLNAKGQQLIFLECSNNTSESNVLNYNKYSRNGTHSFSLQKYLALRYGVIEELNNFNSILHLSRLADEHLAAINKKDSQNSFIKWQDMAKVREYLMNERSVAEEIYNIDMVYFDKPGNDFALVRIDASNYFKVKLEQKKPGSIVGVTFVVYSSNSLMAYQKMFDNLWESAKPTFHELTSNPLC